MMNQNNLVKYYSEIANKLDEIIPCDWYDLAMYAEEFGDNRTACFYYKEQENDTYIHSDNIPAHYGVSKANHLKLLSELTDIVNKFWMEFVRAGEERWSTLTFYLNKYQNFKFKFGYRVNKEAIYPKRELYWAYTELGMIPDDDYGKKLLKEYIEEQGKTL